MLFALNNSDNKKKKRNKANNNNNNVILYRVAAADKTMSKHVSICCREVEKIYI